MKIARLSLFALALTIPLLVAKQSRDLKLLAAQPLALGALAAVVAMRTRQDGLPGVLGPLGAWLAVSAASTLISRSAVSSDELLRQFAFLSIGATGALAFRRSDLSRLAALILVAFVPVAAYAISQRLGFEPVAEFVKWHSQDRPFSTFGNPSFLGTWTAMLVPLFIGAMAGATSWRKEAWGGAAVVSAAVLFTTYSRGAWLGAVAGVAALAFTGRGWPELRRLVTRIPKPALLLAPVLAIAVFLAVVPREQLTRRTDRLLLWEGTLRMIAVKPVAGWGLGSFAAEYPPFAPTAFAERMKEDNTFAEHPHCEYLHVAMESGVAGLGLFLWLLAVIVRQAYFRARRGDRLVAGVLGALVAVLVHIAVDRNFRLASTAVPFWLLAGILWAGPGRTGTIKPGRITLFVCGAFWLLLAAGSLRPLHASYRVEAEPDFLKTTGGAGSGQLEAMRGARARDPNFQVELGNAYAKENNFPRAVAAFEEALRLSPGLGPALNNLGNCWFMMSKFDRAIDAYRMLLARNPSHLDARFNMAYALFHQRRIKEALAECETILKASPGNPKALALKQQLAP
jgi:O-antigen ligase